VQLWLRRALHSRSHFCCFHSISFCDILFLLLTTFHSRDCYWRDCYFVWLMMKSVMTTMCWYMYLSLFIQWLWYVWKHYKSICIGCSILLSDTVWYCDCYIFILPFSTVFIHW
jgi:hypothetical protein